MKGGNIRKKERKKKVRLSYTDSVMFRLLSKKSNLAPITPMSFLDERMSQNTFL